MGFFQAISAVKTAIQIATSAMFIAADIAEFTDNVMRGARAGWAGEAYKEDAKGKTEVDGKPKSSEVAKAAYKIAVFFKTITDAASNLIPKKEEEVGPEQLSLFDNVVPFGVVGET